MTKVTQRKAKAGWTQLIRELAGRYEVADMIISVLDELSPHKPGLYLVRPSLLTGPRPCATVQSSFTPPQQGSWLNMDEIELNLLIGQCLNCRMGSLIDVTNAVSAWQTRRDNLRQQSTDRSPITTPA